LSTLETADFEEIEQIIGKHGQNLSGIFAADGNL
jgi:predicted RNA-binding protein YlqC (UPF0109 family)